MSRLADSHSVCMYEQTGVLKPPKIPNSKLSSHVNINEATRQRHSKLHPFFFNSCPGVGFESKTLCSLGRAILPTSTLADALTKQMNIQLYDHFLILGRECPMIIWTKYISSCCEGSILWLCILLLWREGVSYDYVFKNPHPRPSHCTHMNTVYTNTKYLGTRQCSD